MDTKDIKDQNDITEKFKFVVAKEKNDDKNESLFCICYELNQIRIFKDCVEQLQRKTIYNQVKYILHLDEINYSDDIDKQIIDAFRRCQLFDLDFGPHSTNNYYVIFSDIDKNYQFPEKNSFIKSIRMEFDTHRKTKIR